MDKLPISLFLKIMNTAIVGTTIIAQDAIFTGAEVIPVDTVRESV